MCSSSGLVVQYNLSVISYCIRSFYMSSILRLKIHSFAGEHFRISGKSLFRKLRSFCFFCFSLEVSGNSFLKGVNFFSFLTLDNEVDGVVVSDGRGCDIPSVDRTLSDSSIGPSLLKTFKTFLIFYSIVCFSLLYLELLT